MRLIDADELKKNFQDELCKGIACAECSMQAEGFCRVERWIDIAPTVEAEIKQGRWEKKGISIKGIEKEFCSECKTWSYGRNKAFCPNCGAKMDGGENGRNGNG